LEEGKIKAQKKKRRTRQEILATMDLRELQVWSACGRDWRAAQFPRSRHHGGRSVVVDQRYSDAECTKVFTVHIKCRWKTRHGLTRRKHRAKCLSEERETRPLRPRAGTNIFPIIWRFTQESTERFGSFPTA